MTEKKNIYAALAKFQGKCPEINLDGKVDFTSKKTGVRTKYDYASLPNIIDKIKKPLSDCGLSVYNKIEGSKLTTVVCYAETGETIESSMDIKDNEDLKSIGGQITYCRRYMLISLLGIAPLQDTDASGLEKAGKPKLSPDKLQMAVVKIIEGVEGANLESLHRAFDLTHEQIYVIVDAERKAIERLEGEND